MQKRWKVLDATTNEVTEKYPQMNRIILQLLSNRGLAEQNEINDFLNPSYDKHVLDPFLFNDMEVAVNRLLQAAENKEKVLIYGDYDADGVCSSAVLYNALKELGMNVSVRIPFREKEGYGLNMNAAKEIVADNFKLVITVDCGISNKEEVTFFKENNVDVIITDHHQQPAELPTDAVAMINPSLKDSKYPFIKLCGAGVAFKVVQGLMKKQDNFKLEKKIPIGFDKWLLDLVAIATVGDIVPLIGENRIFVKYGLIVLDKTKRKGINKIIEKVNHYAGKLDSTFIGWRIVPRINAAGRVNHASLAFDLVTSDDDDESEKLIDKLEGENTRRQSITTKILKEANAQVGEVTNQKMLWAVGEDWNPGVVGLVAGRISDKNHLPTLIIFKNGDKYVGSGRSVNEFDITAGLSECSEYLDRFGGHPQACGFTVIGEDNFNKFKEKLTSIAQEKLKDADLRPVLEIDAQIELKDIDWDLVNEMNKFEPFGEANPTPLFVIKNLKIEQIQTVGADGKHMRAMVSQENHPVVHKIIGFSFGEWCKKLSIGDKIDMVFELGINEWNGNKELQLKVVDLKLSE